MPDFPQPFFVTGGTLPADAPSYVTRRADRELFDHLDSGDFCYVLNTRQMGKSSLMVRAARKLRSEGHASAVLDITATGQNVTPEQFYDGLLLMLGQQLARQGNALAGVDDALQDFWLERSSLGPMQRFFAAIETVVLPRVPRSLIVFVDEIDAVRSLPFSADEFFGGIRECHNRRARDPIFSRLTFCLIGVATPADLIADARLSPFNVGKRIALSDFTPDEAASALTPGIPGGATLPGTTLLTRVLFWTGGHPYLTQRFLESAIRHEISTPSAIDSLCEGLFLTKAARETDDNLAFVRNRLLRSESDLAALLDLYRDVRRGRVVRDDDTDPLCASLRLSGVVATDSRGFLRVRNKIYDRVFDTDWVENHVPDAEKRRQKAAYRRGLLRATGVGSLFVGGVGALAVFAVRQARIARALGRISNSRLTETRVADGIRFLDAGDPLRAVGLLRDALRLDRAEFPERVDASRRRLAMAEVRAPARRFLTTLDAPVLSAARSPDGESFALGLENGVARVFDGASGRAIGAEMRHGGPVHGVAFDPTGSRIATASDNGAARVWDARTGAPRTPWIRYHDIERALDVVWSPDARRIAISGAAGSGLWDAETGREIRRVWDTDTGYPDTKKAGVMETRSVTFSPDGTRLAFVANTYLANFASTKTGKMDGVLERCYNGARILYGPDGRRLAIVGEFLPTKNGTGAVPGGALYDGETGRMIALLPHRDYGADLRFSPDGAIVATVGRDGFGRLWDAKTGAARSPWLAHDGGVASVEFSRDGSQIVTASSDGAARIWRVADGEPVAPILRHESGGLRYACFLERPDSVLTVGADGVVCGWNLPAPETISRRIASIETIAETVANVDFDARTRRLRIRHDGRGNNPVRIRTIDLRSGREFLGPPDGFTLVPFRAGGEFFYLGRTETATGGGFAIRTIDDSKVTLTTSEPVAIGRELHPAGGETLAWVVLSGRGRLQSQVFVPRTGAALSPKFVWGEQFFLASERRLVPMPADLRQEWFLISDGGTVVAAAAGDGRDLPQTIALWNAKTGARATLPIARRDFETGDTLWFSPDDRHVLVGGRNAGLWDSAHARPLDGSFPRARVIACAAFTSDGGLVATGSDDGMVEIRSVARGRAVRALRLSRGTAVDLAFSPDDRLLATAGSDGAARVWDARTGEPVSPALSQDGGIRRVFFTGDDALLTAGETQIREWRPAPNAAGR